MIVSKITSKYGVDVFCKTLRPITVSEPGPTEGSSLFFLHFGVTLVQPSITPLSPIGYAHMSDFDSFSASKSDFISRPIHLYGESAIDRCRTRIRNTCIKWQFLEKCLRQCLCLINSTTCEHFLSLTLSPSTLLKQQGRQKEAQVTCMSWIQLHQ